ncbi:unnamed protein product [Lactuca saligna]|uniref:Uncharacterized protein n=1 Tax=Lactuca saligna TaxID=75948 RepID=A0AA35Y8Y5_LACSI|nr:unnamed protein product [Lactuca saligna]
MQQPITFVFPSQSTEGPKTINDDETNDGGFVSSFADGGGKHSVLGIKVDVMLQAQEHRIQDKIDQIDKNNELRVKAQSENFNGALSV